MGYLNRSSRNGLARFAADAGQAGVDGVIVVDCPPEEADPVLAAFDPAGLAADPAGHPHTDDARLPAVVRRTSGFFVYYVSVAGVTGGKAADADAVAPAVTRVRAASGLPVAVGFGIRTPEQAAAVARVADAGRWWARPWSTRAPPPSHRTVIRSQKFWKPRGRWVRLSGPRD